MFFMLLKNLLRMMLIESAAVTLSFAAIFPALILFYSMAFDGASLNNKRARLMDGVNQGVLAVALTDNRNATAADKLYNKNMLGTWVRYYLPGVTVPDADLAIEVTERTDEKGTTLSVDYSGSALAQVKIALSGSSDAGLGPAVDMSADQSIGLVRKSFTQLSTPTDFVFVIDFSGSMLGTRIKLVKSIVADFASMALVENNIGNTIGIVPYSIGTPESLDKDNLAGGKELGCSFAGKLNSAYRIDDFDFWYNKNLRDNASTVKAAAYYADKYLYENYYNSIVIGAISPATWGELVSRRWCQANNSSGTSVGRYNRSCEVGFPSSLFADNDNSALSYKSEFTNNYKKATQLMVSSSKHLNIINIDTLDVTATLAGDYLFSDAAITTYIHQFMPNTKRPFYYMCEGAFGGYSAKNFKSVTKPNYYPIALTTNITDLDPFQSMTALGGTDSVNGLLRAIPVITKGNNSRKVIILFTDGEDSGSVSAGPLALRNLLVRDRGLCSVIKNGLLKYPAGTLTTSSEMYYFSLVSDKARIDFWQDNCVGAGNAIEAQNYKELMTALTAIASKGQVKFVNKNEAKN